MTSSGKTKDPKRLPRKPFYKELYFLVALGIVAGVVLGVVDPARGEAMKPLGDGFIKLIRMMIAPVVFFTVVVGISSVGDLKKLGRVGLKALAYFEIVSTISLGIGLLVVTVWKPGKGFNVDASTLDPKAVSQYTGSGEAMHTVDFLLNIIPDTAAGAFAKGEILQVLFLAILFGLALAMFEGGKPIIAACDGIAHVLFRIIDIIMKASPIGAFGAMAFTIGKYGLKAMMPLSQMLLCVYLTGAIFIFVVLGSIARIAGFSLWRLLRYIREELIVVLGTSSSESALPGLIRKLEEIGCSRSVVGLVVPSGYSFNLDGTSIYLTIAAIFLAQATNTNLSVRDEFVLLLVLMLTSKGAAAVTGGGFITLAATLASTGMVPVASIALLLGVDRFMSQMRSLVNLVGNAVATVLVARWENEFDSARAKKILDTNDN